MGTPQEAIEGLQLSDEIRDVNDNGWPIALRKGKRACTQKKDYSWANYANYRCVSKGYRAFLTTIESVDVPRTWQHVIRDKIWKAAMDDEMNALTRNGTWEIVTLPKDKKPIGCRWVFTLKYNSDGSVERYKARLVAKGYTQEYGIDYEETFAPVAKMNTVRVLIALAANFDWDLLQYDVKNAFLNGDLEEEVYMKLPPGYYKSEDSVICKLKKSIYGLKQSPKAWFDKFSGSLRDMGYYQCYNDHALFIKRGTSGKVSILLVYVDDIIITGDDKEANLLLSQRLAQLFEVKSLGRMRYFLGIEVAYSKTGIFISQHKYIMDLLKETCMSDCKPSAVLIDPNSKLKIDEKDSPADKGRYQRLVGKLNFLNHTRPDITYIVGLLTQFMKDPRESHWQAAHRVLAYLKGTARHRLFFKRNGGLKLEVFTDADFGGSMVDRSSTSTYCSFLGGNLVTWKSKKQSDVALSSAEAEFRALLKGICEAI